MQKVGTCYEQSNPPRSRGSQRKGGSRGCATSVKKLLWCHFIELLGYVCATANLANYSVQDTKNTTKCLKMSGSRLQVPQRESKRVHLNTREHFWLNPSAGCSLVSKL